MDYRDRDRLGVSFLISAVLHGILFALAMFFPWGEFEPFPETEPLVLVELQEFPVRTAADTPAPAVEERQAEIVRPEPSPPPPPAPRAAEKAAATQAAIRPAGKAAAPPVRPAGKTPPPAAPPETPAPAAVRTPPADDGVRLSARASSFLAGPPRRDENLEAELNFLEKQKKDLEEWLRSTPVQAPVPDAASGAASPAPGPAADPEREMRRQFERELAEVEARIADTRVRAAAPAQPEAGAASRQIPERTPIRDRQGREIGVGVLEGRSPRGGLALDLTRADFGGEPPPETQIFAEFDILEAGIVDPSSLKISGDTRYTNATEKIRTALSRWGFSPLAGVRTRARIVIVVKSADVR